MLDAGALQRFVGVGARRLEQPQRLVDPAGGDRRQRGGQQALPASSEDWLAGATRHPGSWWSDHVDWLGERSGDLVPAPERLGSDQHQPSDPAPGTYVLES